MTNPMNRRAVLGSLFGAAFVAVPIAAAATSNPDARLFELIEEGKHWWEQIGVYCTLCDEVARQRRKAAR